MHFDTRAERFTATDGRNGILSRNVAAGSPATAEDGSNQQLHGRKARRLTEFLRRHEGSLKAVARRYAASAEDAEDAYQRAIELLLTKGPDGGSRVWLSWTHTVIRHEALRLRRGQGWTWAAGDSSRLEQASADATLGPRRPEAGDPADVYERRDDFGRFRQCFLRLKRNEQRALCLIGEGYTYGEISEITGWTRTKLNRHLSEGRSRLRGMLAGIEDGRRCAELAGPISRLADGEASEIETAEAHDHLRVCLSCRAKLTNYRAIPGRAAALFPALPAHPSVGDRLQELGTWLQSAVAGRTGLNEAAATLAAGGSGTRGGGMAMLAKLAVVCVGAGGGAAACVATGILPPPSIDAIKRPVIERESTVAAGNEIAPVPQAAATGAETSTPNDTGAKPGQESTEVTMDKSAASPEKATVSLPEVAPHEAEFGPEAAGVPLAADTSEAQDPIAVPSAGPPDGGEMKVPPSEPTPPSSPPQSARPALAGGAEFAP